jgi:uncharacterized membrane protein YcaP (DUF421 family)
MAAALRAFFGYFFLLFIVRIAGRRPGKQLTPFEFVLVFFMGGLALTAMVGQELSFTNALCQIIAIAVAHYIVAFCRFKFPKFARLTDGTPLVLLEKQCWHSETLKRMGVQQEDVMASARESSVPSLQEIDVAVLERNGEINVLQQRQNA